MLINDMVFEKTLSPSITRCRMNDLTILQVQSRNCEATISLHGGHLMQFKPFGHQPVLWLSNKAVFSKEKAIRGGVPICWPWFGPVHTPSHGFARIAQWQLANFKENEKAVTICLKLSDSDQTWDIWPHRFNATLTFSLGKTLSINLEMVNTDQTPWRWSGALHSYFNVGEAVETMIHGAGEQYIDSLQDDLHCTTKKGLTIDQPIDRIYAQPDEIIAIDDTKNNRIIHVHNQGHNSAVIWNPWKELSTSMTDMSDDGYKTMVCVEATHYASNIESGKELLPHQKHSLSTTISVSMT